MSRTMATTPSSPPPPGPPPPPPLQTSSSKQQYYYIIIVGLALMIALLLLTNAFAARCFQRRRRLPPPRAVDSYGEVHLWIPARKHQRSGRDEEERDVDCAVCLSLFDEGDEVRELPPCGHLFHAVCIDKWFQLHSSCPVCRSTVLPTPSHSVDFSHQHSWDDLIAGRLTTEGVGGV